MQALQKDTLRIEQGRGLSNPYEGLADRDFGM